MHIQYSPRRFYPNLPDSCRTRDLRTPVYFYYLHSNRNFSTRTRGNTVLWGTNEGKGFAYSSDVREFGSIRRERIERVFRVSCIGRARIGRVFLRRVSIRNVARGEARMGEGSIVHSTLLLLWHNLLSPLLLARATKSNPRRRGNESDDVKCYASK